MGRCVGRTHLNRRTFWWAGTSRGQWVVRDQRARCGGLFDSRAEALRFAFRERGEAPGAVVLVPDVLELFEAPIDAATTPDGPSDKVRATAPRILLEV